ISPHCIASGSLSRALLAVSIESHRGPWIMSAANRMNGSCALYRRNDRTLNALRRQRIDRECRLPHSDKIFADKFTGGAAGGVANRDPCRHLAVQQISE